MATSSSTHILDLLKKHHTLSVPQLVEHLKPILPTLNKTTVYRALEKLIKENQIREVHLNDRKTYYELSGDHHHHIICTSCDRIEEIHLPHHLEEIENNLSTQTGFLITDHHLEFFGKCGECR